MNLSDLYRKLPPFKGKKRIGTSLFRKALYSNEDRLITCKDGLKFHILNTYDSVSRYLFFDGIYEPKTQKAIEDSLVEGDVFVDAGANIGAISLPIAHRRNVRVFAFEPGQRIFRALEDNIKVNQLKNIKGIPLALSSREGVVDFYESDKVHGWSSMVKIDNFQCYRISSTTLDIFAFENNIEKIAALKADVQGWEYHIFKGAERLLDEKKIDTVIFEFESWAEGNAGLELGASQKFLIEKGYSLFTLDGERIIEPIREGSMVLKATFG